MLIALQYVNLDMCVSVYVCHTRTVHQIRVNFTSDSPTHGNSKGVLYTYSACMNVHNVCNDSTGFYTGPL